MPRNPRLPGLACLLLLVSLVPAFAESAVLGPISPVVWIDKVVGAASFSPVGTTGEDAWVPATPNVVVSEGASIFTQGANQDQPTEVELRWAGGSVRIAANSSVTLQRQDEQAMLLVLNQGTLNVSLNALQGDRKFEVGTANAGLQMTAVGQYHFETDAQGKANTIRVDAGQIVAKGSSGQTVIDSGQTARLNGDSLQLDPLQPPTNTAYQPAPPSPAAGSMGEPSGNSGFYGRDADPGSDQLAAYGQWAALPSGQQAWYPNVGSEWSPYTDGHWQWVDPGGWTWIDNAAWGFTPSHYGRWGYAGSRWYWVPGAPVYSPAVVAWVGTPQMVAWVPLAPGESVNGIVTVSRFANHEHITAIPQQAFVSAAPVSGVRMPFPRGYLDRTYVSSFVQVRPERLSILGSNVRAPQPPVASLQRSYVSSVQAAPRPLALEARLQTYRSSPLAGRPLERTALRSTANDPAARPLAGGYAQQGYGRPAGSPGGYGAGVSGHPAGAGAYGAYRNGGYGYGQYRPGIPAAPMPGVNRQPSGVPAPQRGTQQFPGHQQAAGVPQAQGRPQPQARPHPAPRPQPAPAAAKHR